MSVNMDERSMRDLMKKVSELKELCDVTLVAGIDNQRFPAHRLILIASSKYFETSLGPEFGQEAKKEIVFEDINGTTMETVLSFIYFGCIEINAKNAGDILAAAFIMELISLGKKCEEFFEANVAPENCVEILLKADEYQREELWSKALEYICDRFEAVPIDDILKIDEKNFLEVLKNDQIMAAETVVFNRLTLWVEENKAIGEKVDSNLLKSIRLKHIPAEVLAEKIEPYFDKYDFGKVVIDEYRKRVQTPDVILSLRRAPEAIYCSFEDKTTEVINIQKYDFAVNDWIKFKTFPYNVHNRDPRVFLNKKMFVLSSYDMESYDLEDWTKTILPPMEIDRVEFTPICIGKYIYAIGGSYLDEDEALSTCERFDTEKSVWQSRQSMPGALQIYGAVEVNNHIYVAGETRCQSSKLYCYNHHNDSWLEKSRLKEVNEFTHTYELAKSNQFIYAIVNDWTVYQYDTTQDIWTKIGSYGPYGTYRKFLNYGNQIFLFCDKQKSEVVKLGENCTFNILNSMSLPVPLWDVDFFCS